VLHPAAVFRLIRPEATWAAQTLTV